MTDRIVHSAWWLALMAMICALAGISLFVGYRGLLDLLAAHWMTAGICGTISAISGAGAMTLCRYRNDLL